MVGNIFKLTNLTRNSNYLRKLKFRNHKYIATAQPYPVPSSSSVNFQLRNMKEADIPKVIEVRRELGTHALECESCLYTWLKLDPEGINIVEHESGDIMGAGLTINYPEDLAIFGMLSVRKKYRDLGIGTKLLDETIPHAGTRNGGVYAVPNKVYYYRDLHFPVLVEDFTCTKNISTTNINTNILSADIPAGVVIQPYQETLLGAICSFDFNLIDYRRNLLLELSCKEKNSRTFVAMKDGICVGFGSIKLTCLGYGRVGPLYADDSGVAEVLLKTLVESFPEGNGFSMVALSNNYFATDLMKKLDVPTVQHLSQMFVKRRVNVNTSKVFAVFDVNGAIY